MRDEAREWFAVRLGRPLPAPPERRAGGPAQDPVAMLAARPPPDAIDLGGIVLWLAYVDDEGAASERPVRCRRAWIRDGRGYLTGYCELRREPRLFRLDRIALVVDPGTGEVHETVPFFAGLGLTSSDATWFAFLGALRRGLVVLSALARADGHLVADEVEAVVRWADRLADRCGLVLDEATARTVRRVAGLMHPSLEDALAATEAIAADPAEARILLRAARDLVSADDHVSIEERRLAEWLGLE